MQVDLVMEEGVAFSKPCRHFGLLQNDLCDGWIARWVSATVDFVEQTVAAKLAKTYFAGLLSVAT